MADMAPADVKKAAGEEEVAEVSGDRRWYHYDGTFVDLEEFKAKPMGMDIAKHHGTDPNEPAGQTVEEAVEAGFKRLMTEDEVKVRGDEWALKEMANLEKPWGLLSGFEKVEVLVVGFVKFCAIWGVLYMFIIALGIMGNAFKILGGRSSGRAFRESDLITNPVSALAIGIMATVLMQSSSTTTSIVISMAASDLVTIEDACYLVMGANIGTSVTNTIVSIAHLNSPEEYRRAFTGAVFHDMFNWLTVGMFLPLEVASGFLLELAEAAVKSLGLSDDDEKRKKVEFIKKITKPASGRVVSVDKKLIEKIAKAKTSEEVKKLEDGTIIKQTSGHVLRDMPMADEEAGILLLFVSLTMLAVCLLMLVKLLQSVLKGRVAVWTRYLLNLEFKHPCLRACGGVDSYILMLFGTGCTILVQSSSVFTSTLTPLVGIGMIHIEKATALTHGANIGTTVTGVLSALSGSNVAKGMTVALEHVFFNTLGTVVWFFVWPLRPVPLNMAKFMGETAGNLAWFPLAYILLSFFLMPFLIIGLALAGWEVLAGVMIPIALCFVGCVVWIYLRRNRADLLPAGCLRASQAPCGCRYPNFMQLWGGNMQDDIVDMEQLRLDEEEEKRRTGSVREWNQSPMAWGLLILSFIGAMLALPTSQWRRVQYRTESRKRKEVGVGLYEMCSAAYEKDQTLVEAPPACDQALLAKCAASLVGTCARDPEWATTSSAMGHEEDLYEEAWEQCSQRGCRAYDWSVACPQIPSCAGRAGHKARCEEPLASYFWFQHRQVEERQCVAHKWAEAKDDTQRVFPHNSHFFSGELSSEKNQTAAAYDMGASVNRWRAGDSVVGLALDSCTGVVSAVSARDRAAPTGLGQCAGARTWAFELETTVPSRKGKKVRTLDFALGDDGVASAPQDVPLPCGETFGDVQVLSRKDQIFVAGVTGASVPTIRVWNGKTGAEMQSYTPAPASGANTDPLRVLPSVFAQAGTTGFAALAVSPSKDALLACLEAPMKTGSQAVRCAMVNVTDPAAPKLISQKVVLLSDAEAVYAGRGGVTQASLRLAGASWTTKDKVVLLERADFAAMNKEEPAGNPTAAVAYEADFSTGDNLADNKNFTQFNGDAASALNLEDAVVGVNSAHAMVSLKKTAGVRAVAMRRVVDLKDVQGVPSSNVGAVLVANEYTLLVADAGAAAGGNATYAPVMAVNLRKALGGVSEEKCPEPKLAKLESTGEPCRKISEVCPEGDLEGDMGVVAGLAITGSVFLGIGMVVTVLYSLWPWHAAFKMGHFIAAGTLSLAWIFLLAAWAHLDQLTGNTYSCYMEDESLRGGFVLTTGSLECLTRHSYSWGFCIYAWGMLTLALGAVYHRVFTEVMYPHDPEAAAREAEEMPVKEAPLA